MSELKDIVEEMMPKGIVPSEEQPKIKVHPNTWASVDAMTEVIDRKNGWICKKNRDGSPGKPIRKYCEYLRGTGNYYEDGILYWKPRIKDLITCEAKRWKAIQKWKKHSKSSAEVWNAVCNAGDFCCVRTVNDFPGYRWTKFNIREDGYMGRCLSHDYPDEPPKDVPLRQDLGDLYFDNEERGMIMRRRVGYFEILFEESLNYYYGRPYHEDRFNLLPTMQLIINGRSYIVGHSERDRSFGIIVPPEKMQIQEIITNPVKESCDVDEWY